jgi:ADP-ribosylglycohydrolase
MPTPRDRARLSLEGLSVGDAFGERFFVYPSDRAQRTDVPYFDAYHAIIEQQTAPPPPWLSTDDSEMARSIVAILRQYGHIDQDALIKSFVAHYTPARGYGPAMHRLMRQIGSGADWRSAAGNLFEGQGSYGNGAAMRVAPVGAFFADDRDQVIDQARRSAEVTHAHPEGVAGAIAVALAAAWAWRIGQGSAPHESLVHLVLPQIPESEVRSKLARAATFDDEMPAPLVGAKLGNGSLISAQDTVPFTIWCAGRFLADYPAALWAAASSYGDVDTTCAIIGGIVARRVGWDGIPNAWRTAREVLPSWPFGND